MQVFVEYVMLARVNDNPQQAHQLGRLLSHRPEQYMVNLIPWNPVYSPDINFEAPGPERLAEFHSVVRSHNVICTVRKEMGQEIEGATVTQWHHGAQDQKVAMLYCLHLVLKCKFCCSS